MKPEGILWETKPNRARFDILLGFILFSPTYRFAAGSWELNPQRLKNLYVLCGETLFQIHSFV